jgi:hypothetical protein
MVGRARAGTARAQTSRQVRRRCERELRRLDVPRPFDIVALCESVAHRRGRRMQIHRVHSLPGPCGWWLAVEDADHVYVEAGTSPLHQTLIILHELSHMLLDHRCDHAIDSMFPLTGRAAGHFLARSDFEPQEEREAELLASLILADAGWEPRAEPSAADAPAEAAAILERLSLAFGPQSPA